MHLAAHAPWALSAAVRLVVTSIFLVPIADSIVVRSQPKSFSLLSIEQVPGPTPQWVEYGPPQFTTFGNSTSACQACIEFFPEKEDGKRFHSDLYADRDGGIWPRTCRAGSCDFRDPQTQPVGGIIGKGVGPGGAPDGKTCITRDPVPWYTDCEPVALAAAKSITEVTQYCSYKNQLFIPPPAENVSYLAGSAGKAWRRIGGSKEQCLSVIEKQGSALHDTTSFCDSNLLALSGCCETIFSSLNCVAETSVKNGLWSQDQGSIFSIMEKDAQMMLESFAQYCVPLCQNTKEEFCEKFPGTDICVSYGTCSDCTAAGGLWCPKLESCHCPGPKPPCIKPPVTTPLQCLPKEEKPEKEPLNMKKNGKRNDAAAGPDAPPDKDEEGALCKYHEFALKWLKED